MISLWFGDTLENETLAKNLSFEALSAFLSPEFVAEGFRKADALSVILSLPLPMHVVESLRRAFEKWLNEALQEDLKGRWAEYVAFVAELDKQAELERHL